MSPKSSHQNPIYRQKYLENFKELNISLYLKIKFEIFSFSNNRNKINQFDYKIKKFMHGKWNRSYCK